MTAHPATKSILGAIVTLQKSAGKRWSEVTVGDYAAMTTEQRKAYDDEWWRRVTRDDGREAEPRGFTGQQGDDNRDDGMRDHEHGE